MAFEVRDALDKQDFPAEHERYDCVHLSLATSWVPTRAKWKDLLQRCYAALDSDGVMVITECEAVMTSSEALYTLQSLILKACKASGRGPAFGEHHGVVEHLGRTLRCERWDLRR